MQQMIQAYIKSNLFKKNSIPILLVLFILLIASYYSRTKTLEAWIITAFITFAEFLILYLIFLIDKKKKTGIFFLALSAPIIGYLYELSINIFLSKKMEFLNLLIAFTCIVTASVFLKDVEEDKNSLKRKSILFIYYVFMWVITIAFSL